ncbi:VOC family protein [Microbacterium sp. 179-I 3D4 NHS]|uniref:VOC family protein n=1 Tax=Microbacterium sp. 179-I 3D4 NHS TaxID=3142381 RepID=UPI00399FA424
MTITSVFPILRTSDLPRLCRFYETAFDAAVTYRFAHEGRDVYVALTLGGAPLGIGWEPEVARGEAIAVWLYCDDVDRVSAVAVDSGAELVDPPEDQPWGERVAQVRDPDGNLLYLATAADDR